MGGGRTRLSVRPLEFPVHHWLLGGSGWWERGTGDFTSMWAQLLGGSGLRESGCRRLHFHACVLSWLLMEPAMLGATYAGAAPATTQPPLLLPRLAALMEAVGRACDLPTPVAEVALGLRTGERAENGSECRRGLGPQSARFRVLGL